MYKRICPNCNKELYHKDKKYRNKAERKKISCKKCSSNNDWKKKISLKHKGKPKSKEHKEKLRQINLGKTYSKKINMKKASYGIKNGMFGKSYYDVWVEKYGIEEADKKLIELKKKQSKNSSGKNNPMYGKLSPNGAGNGWSGWYKGWHFRSLLELSYMIKIIERFNLKYENGEKTSIPYLHYDGQDRTYRPDFIIENKYMIEVKPKRLINTPLVQLKTKAGQKYCKENNMKYKITNVKKLSMNKIIDLYKKGLIKFSKKYKILIEEII